MHEFWPHGIALSSDGLARRIFAVALLVTAAWIAFETRSRSQTHKRDSQRAAGLIQSF